MLKTVPRLLPWMLMAAIGCDNENARLADQARRHSEVQAGQNQEIARVAREAAEGAKRLVEADAAARQQMLTLQQDLQAERRAIAAGRDALEAERQQLAIDRRRDPIIANAVMGAATILACLLPLALCGYLLHSLRAGGPSEEVCEVLITDLVSSAPLLLPAKVTETPANLTEKPLPHEPPTA